MKPVVTSDPNNPSQQGGNLGSLSAKYESGGAGAGTIARTAGDWGGASYGTYQIATATGTMKSFVNFVTKTGTKVYDALKGKSPGSPSFDKAWKSLAKNDPSGFEKIQHDFIKSSHFSPAASKIQSNTGLNVNTRSTALQSAVWSMSTQHGAAGASNIFRNAGIKPGMSDKEVLQRVYTERMNVNKYFSKSSPTVKSNVKKRFQNELKDALAMLGDGGQKRGGVR